jgi:hypothetical protein
LVKALDWGSREREFKSPRPDNARLVPYDPELIDLFFIVDGDLSLYLIPSKVIAGRVGLLLRTYEKYIVGNAAGLMAPRSDAA